MDTIIQPGKIEKIKTPERVSDFESSEISVSSAMEAPPLEQVEKIGEKNLPLVSDLGVGAPGIDSSKTPLHQNIEAVLEEDLGDLYFSLSPEKQKIFKAEGEQTAKKIIELIETAKITFRRVFNLIKKWLKIIPGLNRFFVEQEAKIKADRILEIEK
ncbi:MAG TPA: hypothetical protein PKZ16_00960 [bacterium]|nr:hypothetical protein [bacterium]HPL95453.1 hypothetical protein [bacterium]